MSTIEESAFQAVLAEREEMAEALLAQLLNGELNALLSAIYRMEKLINQTLTDRRRASTPHSVVADGDDMRGEGE